MTARTRDDHHDATRQLQQAFQRALDERVGESADFAAREAAGLEPANELFDSSMTNRLIRDAYPRTKTRTNSSKS